VQDDDLEFASWQEIKVFSSLYYPAWSWGPTSFVFNWYCGTFKGEKCLGCDFDQALVSTSKVRNEWNCISASHRDKCRVVVVAVA